MKTVLISIFNCRRYGWIVVFCLGLAPLSGFGQLDRSWLELEVNPLQKMNLLSPDLFYQALENYKKEFYRQTILELKKLYAVGIPDGRTDTYLFMMAESYNQLQLFTFANQLYLKQYEEYPENYNTPYALYRLQNYYYHNKNYLESSRYYQMIAALPQNHPVKDAALYVQAKVLFLNNNYKEAFELANSISETSSFYFPTEYFSFYYWRIKFS